MVVSISFMEKYGIKLGDTLILYMIRSNPMTTSREIGKALGLTNSNSARHRLSKLKDKKLLKVYSNNGIWKRELAANINKDLDTLSVDPFYNFNTVNF